MQRTSVSTQACARSGRQHGESNRNGQPTDPN